MASDELIALYDQDKDARFHYFEWAESRYNASQNKDFRGYYVTFKLSRNYSDGDLVSDFLTLRLPEIYLNKAEALAMLGQEAEAASVLENCGKTFYFGCRCECLRQRIIRFDSG